jgi:hypothetical protein
MNKTFLRASMKTSAVLIMTILSKAATAITKDFPKASSRHINRLPKAAEVNNFHTYYWPQLLETHLCGHEQLLESFTYSTGGFPDLLNQ